MYYLKSKKGWYLPKAYGYTQKKEQAGVFTEDDLKGLNLDGVTLHSAESFLTNFLTSSTNPKNPKT